MAKTPRLDPYIRLTSRFYEVLILLNLLGLDTGPHRTVEHNPSSPLATRHRFLKNLAFVCDYIKGGDTTTAIAVQECTDSDGTNSFTFWFASNANRRKDVTTFLKAVLALLKQTLALPDKERMEHEKKLTRLCADFAIQRIRNEVKLLSRSAKRCIEHLEGTFTLGSSRFNMIHDYTDENLKCWLRQFVLTGAEKDFLPLCSIAYQNRTSVEMRAIRAHAMDPDDGSHVGKSIKDFQQVRHFIGRLAGHIRVPQQLIEDAGRVTRWLDEYNVERAMPLASVPPPVADEHTTLEGIFTRMLPKGDTRIPDLLRRLAEMDLTRDMQREVRAKYDNGSFTPVVHAEVQLLEHFHRNELKFAGKDRFIACSKPACLCCKLYFRHHPLKCAEPDSHERAHLRWGPPLLQNTHRDNKDWQQQREILIKVRSGLIDATLEKIMDGGPIFAHQDTLTEITPSIDGDWDTPSDSEGDGFSDTSDFVDEALGLTDAEATDEEENFHENEEDDDQYQSGSDGGATL